MPPKPWEQNWGGDKPASKPATGGGNPWEQKWDTKEPEHGLFQKPDSIAQKFVPTMKGLLSDPGKFVSDRYDAMAQALADREKMQQPAPPVDNFGRTGAAPLMLRAGSHMAQDIRNYGGLLMDKVAPIIPYAKKAAVATGLLEAGRRFLK